MKGEFGVAVHALVYLNHRGERRSSEEIAENVCTNPARIRKVMAQLRRAGLVDTREGNEGGFRLAKPAQSITLQEVLAAVDIRLIDPAWRSGSADMNCLIASGMANVMDEIYGELNRRCAETLSGVTIADIDRKLFAEGEKRT